MKQSTFCTVALSVMAVVGATLAGEDMPGPHLRLDLDLVDGSRIIGVSAIESVPVQTPYAKMDVPLTEILTMRIDADHETASLDLRNGDKLKGVVSLKPIELETVFGKVAIGIEHIRRIGVLGSSKLEQLEADAVAGDRNAQMALSCKYEKGDGVPKNLARARELRELAADQGHPNAETARANEYKEKGDFGNALKWYRRSAAHGDAMGYYYAGDLYFHGKGTTQDYREAIRWFEQGFEKKNQYCASSLTVIYNEGKGVPKDPGLAAKYWRKAAEFGLGVAQVNMGDQCRNAGDLKGAEAWYRRAADQGDASAKLRLKEIR